MNMSFFDRKHFIFNDNYCIRISNDSLFIYSAGLYSRQPNTCICNADTLLEKPNSNESAFIFLYKYAQWMYRVTSQFEKYANGRVSEIVAIET